MSDIYTRTVTTVLSWLKKETAYVGKLHDKVLAIGVGNNFPPHTKFVLLHKGTLQELQFTWPSLTPKSSNKSRHTIVNLATLPEANILVPACQNYLDAMEKLATKRASMLHFIGMLQAAPYKYSWAIQQLPPIFRELDLPSDSALPYGEPDAWQEEGIALIFAQPTLDLLGIY